MAEIREGSSHENLQSEYNRLALLARREIGKGNWEEAASSLDLLPEVLQRIFNHWVVQPNNTLNQPLDKLLKLHTYRLVTDAINAANPRNFSSLKDVERFIAVADRVSYILGCVLLAPSLGEIPSIGMLTIPTTAEEYPSTVGSIGARGLLFTIEKRQEDLSRRSIDEVDTYAIANDLVTMVANFMKFEAFKDFKEE